MKTKTMIWRAFLIGIGLFCAFTRASLCPPCPPCYHQTGSYPNCGCAWDCGPCQGCLSGSCANYCISANCESCIGGSCEVCSGDPSKCCLNGSCNTKCGNDCCDNGETCCSGTQGEVCCDSQTETCCDGNCCDNNLGCCSSDTLNPDCLLDENCGCDPGIGGSCNDKKERKHKNPAYIAFSGGGGCKVELGEVLCNEWRDCEDQAYHMTQLCIVADPSFPEGYCGEYLPFYCQDCVGVGIWHPVYEMSTICSLP